LPAFHWSKRAAAKSVPALIGSAWQTDLTPRDARANRASPPRREHAREEWVARRGLRYARCASGRRCRGRRVRSGQTERRRDCSVRRLGGDAREQVGFAEGVEVFADALEGVRALALELGDVEQAQQVHAAVAGRGAAEGRFGQQASLDVVADGAAGVPRRCWEGSGRVRTPPQHCRDGSSQLLRRSSGCWEGSLTAIASEELTRVTPRPAAAASTQAAQGRGAFEEAGGSRLPEMVLEKVWTLLKADVVRAGLLMT